MARVTSQFVSVLLREHFGPIPEKVGGVVHASAPVTLRQVMMKSMAAGVSPRDVKKAMRILMQHDVLTVCKNPHGLLEYELSLKRVQSLLRYPTYMLLAGKLFGSFGQLVILAFLTNGKMTMSQMLQFLKVNSETEAENGVAPDWNLTKSELRSLVKQLYENDFISESDNVSNQSLEEKLEMGEKEEPVLSPVMILDKIYSGELKEAEAEVCTSRKRSHPDEKLASDDGIYWKLNIGRFDQIRRDQMLVDCIKKRHEDEKMAAIFSLILELSSAKTNPRAQKTIPILTSEIMKHAVESKICASEAEVRSYLNVLEMDQGFNQYVRCEGGLYSVQTLCLVESLVKSCLASVVEKRFGYKPLRIFQILLSKKNLHQKVIEDLAMIPPKDSKQIIFNLVKEGFVKTLYYPKSGIDYTYAKTFFFFKIDLDQVVKMTLSRCYKAVHNTIIRKEHEYALNKILLDKKKILDAHLQQEKTEDDEPESTDDMNRNLSTHDSQNIKVAEAICNKLELAQIRVDETIFLLNTWLDMR